MHICIFRRARAHAFPNAPECTYVRSHTHNACARGAARAARRGAARRALHQVVRQRCHGRGACTAQRAVSATRQDPPPPTHAPSYTHPHKSPPTPTPTYTPPRTVPLLPHKVVLHAHHVRAHVRRGVPHVLRDRVEVLAHRCAPTCMRRPQPSPHTGTNVAARTWCANVQHCAVVPRHQIALNSRVREVSAVNGFHQHLLRVHRAAKQRLFALQHTQTFIQTSPQAHAGIRRHTQAQIHIHTPVQAKSHRTEQRHSQPAPAQTRTHACTRTTAALRSPCSAPRRSPGVRAPASTPRHGASASAPAMVQSRARNRRAPSSSVEPPSARRCPARPSIRAMQA